MSSMATSTNTRVRRRKVTQTSNSCNDMPYQVPKNFAKQHKSK